MLASVVLVAACDDPTGTVSDPPLAELAVHLTTPSVDDGAVLMTLHGFPDAPVDVTAVDASLIVHSVRIADTLRIAVFGSITSGPLVQIGPLRGSTASLIGARVDDVASRDNQQRELTGYALTLQRQ
jgi:hypothetical protein